MTETNKTLRNGFSGSAKVMFILSGIAPFIKFNGKQSLFFLGKQVGRNLVKNLKGLFNSEMCDEKESVFARIFTMPCRIISHFDFKKVTKGLNRMRISHLNGEIKRISMALPSISRSAALNSDATFTINKSGKVRFVHTCIQDSMNPYQSQELLLAKIPNSGNTLPDNAGGNPEPSKRSYPLGVCRDYGVSPKGMI